jgi:hypothetical protein
MQPFEAHIPYLLKVTMDYNIPPMGWMHIRTCKVYCTMVLYRHSDIITSTGIEMAQFVYVSTIVFTILYQ